MELYLNDKEYCHIENLAWGKPIAAAPDVGKISPLITSKIFSFQATRKPGRSEVSENWYIVDGEEKTRIIIEEVTPIKGLYLVTGKEY